MVYFTHDNSVYMFFRGCNFHCRGCILILSPWDCHLANDVRNRLQALGHIESLSLNEMEKMLEPLDVEKAILGGGEPTTDMQLPEAVKSLARLDITTVLLSNGYMLEKKRIEELKSAGIDQICVSIKALRDPLHIQYTGRSNRRVLRNFETLCNMGIRIRAESVLIPQLVDKDEIERIARFISSVDPSIPYRIDAYVPVLTAPWRRPQREEVLEAVKEARKYLENVSYISSDMEPEGIVLNIYPQL